MALWFQTSKNASLTTKDTLTIKTKFSKWDGKKKAEMAKETQFNFLANALVYDLILAMGDKRRFLISMK